MGRAAKSGRPGRRGLKGARGEIEKIHDQALVH